MLWSMVLALGISLSGCSGGRNSDPSVPAVVQGAPIDAPAPVYQRPQSPSDPAKRATMRVEAPAARSMDGYSSVTFQQLAGFSYLTDEDGALLKGQEIPPDILALNSRTVAISGFVVPIDYKDDKVSELLLVRNQLLCCFGQEPQLNEWVMVSAEPPVEASMDVPVTFFGRLEVSPEIEDGQVVSLYRLKSSKMEKTGT